MPKAHVNGIDVYYELHGPEGAPVLVLSNGILMTTASWMYQTPVLSRHYRLLLYDCRGQGQSEHPEGPYTMDLHATDLAGLLDALGIGAAHIAGISYGAELSLIFACRYPERTRSLIVASAVSEVRPLLRGIVQGWARAAALRDGDLLFDVSHTDNFSERWIAANAAVLEAARARYRQLDFRAFEELCRAFLTLDVTGQLERITAPALVLVGELDTLKPRPYAEIIAGRIPGAEHVVVPGAGHALCWERPHEFNTLILGFLAKVEGANQSRSSRS